MRLAVMGIMHETNTFSNIPTDDRAFEQSTIGGGSGVLLGERVREVYGDTVRYVNPSRPESIAEGVREVLTDHELSARFALHGRARAELYRKDRSFNAYLALIRSM